MNTRKSFRKQSKKTLSGNFHLLCQVNRSRLHSWDF
uniref:Uncharacterized protein n=1 Tax=Anguilla anguilla TaxID=7936 RepID=A0A0E9PU88_ANGAN